MIRIIMADDHPIVREGLKKIIEKASDISIVAEASNGEELLEAIARIKCDVILLDISMPGKGGIDILEQLHYDKSGFKILVLSMHSEDKYAMRILKSGASGYLTKDKAPLELIAAIRKVTSGGKYISPSLAEKLVVNLESGGEKMPHEKLSNREYQVMCLLASGKPVKDISDILNLSDRTISTYRSRILEKMDMKNNAEITHYAIKNGLVD